MLLTFKENYSALLNFGFKPGMHLLVCGDGPVAMGIARIGQAFGAASVACTGHHDDRLFHIANCVPGCLTINSLREDPYNALKERPLDMIIDAVGDLKSVVALSHLLSHGGVIGLYGVLYKDNASLNLFDIPNDISLHILNWPYGEHRVHKEVCQLVQDGFLTPADYYSHVIPMENVEQAFSMVASREAFKVILKMPGADELEAMGK